VPRRILSCIGTKSRETIYGASIRSAAERATEARKEADRLAWAARPEPKLQPSRVAEGSYPLGMVLSACPDIVDYAKGGISNWRDFLATAAVVRSMLGISPSAWEEAQTVMGEMQAAIVVACVLQRGTAIRSAGGYLRGLTRKAEAGEFSLGPILMSQINSRLHEKRRA
jgi:replication initiation protein RepC